MAQRKVSKLSPYFQGVKFEFESSDPVKIMEIDGVNGQEDGHQGGGHISEGRTIDMAQAEGRPDDRPFSGR